MEYELERTGWRDHLCLLDTTLRAEETQEMIVPDSCPDILQICETDGQVLVTRKTAEYGRVEVAGSMRICVLYCPEGEKGARHLELSLPFMCTAEQGEITEDCQVVASAKLKSGEARVLNPRKILVRAEAVVDVSVFCPTERSLCSRVTEAEEKNVQELIETSQIYPVTLVEEGGGSFTGEISLPGGRPAAVELLKSRVELAAGESKLIGNKLILKGTARIALLYRGEDEEIYPAAGELPLSMILEVSGVAEGADQEILLQLESADLALNQDDDGRSVRVALQIRTQAVLREERTLEILSDAYSTACPVATETGTEELETKVDRGTRLQSVREVWETPGPVREVLDCRLALTEITPQRDGTQLTLTSRGRVELLYRNEDGTPVSMGWDVEIPCLLELPEGCDCACTSAPVGEVYAAPTAGGVEVRFGVEFRYCATQRLTVTSIISLQKGEEDKETERRPSLVLRARGSGERLWDMAKSCSTTVADIMKANELESESDGAGRLLLIPRRR